MGEFPGALFMKYAADFETTTKEDDCRVWAWGIAEVGSEKVEYGNCIETFMERLTMIQGSVYFHNLKFDGGFIIDWLFRNGFTWTDQKRLEEKQFSTLISDMGVWYTIKIRLKDYRSGLKHTVSILDSLKIIPMPISDMPKSFGLTEQKLDLEYTADRPKGWEITEEEKKYLRNDVVILSKSLKYMLSKNMTKMTTGSNALNWYKKNCLDSNEWKKYFPKLDRFTFNDIKKSYKGGYTYLNPKYRNKEVGAGQVYDVNSMYPWAMKYCVLPYGEPIYYRGKYKKSEIYTLYVQHLLCEFKLKPNRYPSIQIKGNFSYCDTEYLTESIEPTDLVLTSVDLELFFHNYEVNVIEWCDGYMMKGKAGLFDKYIDYWYQQKNEAKKDKNEGLKTIAKLMLNSLYGKFGSKMFGKSKIPYFDKEQDKVRYKLSEEEERVAGYIPVAAFITSYCRDKIIRTAEACGDRFIYADTDSVHIEGMEIPEGVDIDEYRLGAFKLEETFCRARFLRQKCYLEDMGNADAPDLNVKCAGMPKNSKKDVTWENFKFNATFEGKLVPRVVPGGVVLREVTYQIKAPKNIDIMTAL